MKSVKNNKTNLASVKKMLSKNQNPWLELFMPDAHIPYHDPLAFALVCKIAKKKKVDGLTNLGDVADMERFSRFKKITGRVPVRAELCAADMAFLEMEAIGAKKNRFLKGNHEIRFEDWVGETPRTLIESHLTKEESIKLHQARIGKTFEDFYDLEDRGWDITQYGECTVDKQLVLSHTLGKNYMSAAKLEKALSRLESHSLIVGHSHFSCKVGYQTFLNKLRVEGYTFGWLGSREAGIYRTSFEIATEWPLGFGLGWKYPDGRWDIYAIKIDPITHTARIFGEEFSLTPQEKKDAFSRWSEKSLMEHKMSMFKDNKFYNPKSIKSA